MLCPTNQISADVSDSSKSGGPERCSVCLLIRATYRASVLYWQSFDELLPFKDKFLEEGIAILYLLPAVERRCQLPLHAVVAHTPSSGVESFLSVVASCCHPHLRGTLSSSRTLGPLAHPIERQYGKCIHAAAVRVDGAVHSLDQSLLA